MLFVKRFFALAGKIGCRGQKRETPGGPLGPPGVVVRAWGLEPQRIAAREPKSRMSTNSIMPADYYKVYHRLPGKTRRNFHLVSSGAMKLVLLLYPDLCYADKECRKDVKA